MADVITPGLAVRSSDGIFSEKEKNKGGKRGRGEIGAGEKKWKETRETEKEREREREREKKRERGIETKVYFFLKWFETVEKRRRFSKEVEEEQHVTNDLYKGGERQGEKHRVLSAR